MPYDTDLRRTVTRDLPCRLTQDEILDRGRQQAREVVKLQTVQAEKKTVTAELGAQEKKHLEEVHRLARIVTSGQEWRAVECDESVDLRQGVVRLVRMDTGEEISCRPLTAKEKQGTFAFEGEPA